MASETHTEKTLKAGTSAQDDPDHVTGQIGPVKIKNGYG